MCVAPSSRRGRRVLVAVFVMSCGAACQRLGAIAPAEEVPSDGTTGSSATAEPRAVRGDSQIRYVLPVDAEVVDAFRPPVHRFGSGNRGWELATRGGEPVRAVGRGVVSFAGQVAGRGVVSILHPDGLLSSVTGLTVVGVHTGEPVVAGEPIGVAAPALHLGFRRNGRYVDPATVYGLRRHAYLVPMP